MEVEGKNSRTVINFSNFVSESSTYFWKSNPHRTEKQRFCFVIFRAKRASVAKNYEKMQKLRQVRQNPSFPRWWVFFREV